MGSPHRKAPPGGDWKLGMAGMEMEMERVHSGKMH